MSNKEIAIRVNDLSKCYMIGSQKQAHNTLRDVIAGKVRSFGKRSAKKTGEEFWALKDVSFDVYKGETLGIIGSNGAGKSTILKILSKIVVPTSGSFATTGRVASLLEVGTGFHPELSGRENVYFNGSVLGMTHREIEQRFDEIVEFSEIGKFIDTPVKFYSSGMYVRLAFAIAAHLDPEILIIDEALAVGDMAFQQKCVERMRSTARSGKTVLFVSHSMNIIENLCDRVMYLKGGEVQAIGEPVQIVGKYLGQTQKQLKTSWKISDKYVDPPGNPVLPVKMQLLTQDHKPVGPVVVPGEDVIVDLVIDVKEPSKGLSVGVSLFNSVGAHILRTAVTDPADKAKRLSVDRGETHLQVTLKTQDLLDGTYVVALDCDLYKKEWVHNPFFSAMRTSFTVKNDGSAPAEAWDEEREGFIKPLYTWQKP